MISIKDNTIDDFLGWNKILISINSASLMSMLFKFSDVNYLDNFSKIATVSFLLSIVFLIATYVGLIEHKNVNTDKLMIKTFIVLTLGWGFFMLGYFSITLKILSL